MEWKKHTTKDGRERFLAVTTSGLRLNVYDWKGRIPENGTKPLYCQWEVFDSKGETSLARGDCRGSKRAMTRAEGNAAKYEKAAV